MRQSPHGKKVLRTPVSTAVSTQDLIEEVMHPRSPSLDVLNQRWQKIRLLILQELADQSSRG